MFKKLYQLIAVLLVTTMTLSIPIYAQEANVNVQQLETVSMGLERNQFSSYDDEILTQIVNEYGLTEDQVKQIDNALTDVLNSSKARSLSIGSVAAFVAATVAVTGATYAAGRYAARQCEVRLGLSKRQYRANRWLYRAALSSLVFSTGGTGVVVAIGFDDYYMGV